MKATSEVPDEVYRRVKAKSALQGRTLREMTTELYPQWLDEWPRLGGEPLRDAPPGPTATEILAADRNRLEPR